MQFAGLKCEIQVRTAVQHAWAVIDRNLRYNNDEDIPTPIKRKLFRVSALLEIADKEFSDINEAVRNLRKLYKSSVGARELNIDIDLDSINAYISDPTVINMLVETANKSGIEIDISSDKDKNIGQCVKLIKLVGFKSIDQVDKFLQEKGQEARHFFDGIIASGWSTKSTTHWLSTYIIILLVLTRPKSEIESIIAEMKFGPKFANAIRSYYDLPAKIESGLQAV